MMSIHTNVKGKQTRSHTCVPLLGALFGRAACRVRGDAQTLQLAEPHKRALVALEQLLHGLFEGEAAERLLKRGDLLRGAVAPQGPPQAPYLLLLLVLMMELRRRPRAAPRRQRACCADGAALRGAAAPARAAGARRARSPGRTPVRSS